MLRCLLTLALILLVAGCTAPGTTAGEPGGAGRVSAKARSTQQGARPLPLPQARLSPATFALPSAPALPRPRPAIVKASQPLQCVPYARMISGIDLRGDAWTWWNKANGLYAKGKTPRPGSVLVLSKTRRLPLGHLAAVIEVRNSREIVVHQANWLNGGRIHRYTPVRDVSKNNDWSVVRVWYTPGRTWGSRSYAAYGFIYPASDGLPEVRQARK